MFKLRGIFFQGYITGKVKKKTKNFEEKNSLRIVWPILAKDQIVFKLDYGSEGILKKIRGQF